MRVETNLKDCYQGFRFRSERKNKLDDYSKVLDYRHKLLIVDKTQWMN
jgi:hypothetical protein